MVPALLYSALPFVSDTFPEVIFHYKIVPMIKPPQCSWVSHRHHLSSVSCHLLVGTRYFYIMENQKRWVEPAPCIEKGTLMQLWQQPKAAPYHLFCCFIRWKNFITSSQSSCFGLLVLFSATHKQSKTRVSFYFFAFTPCRGNQRAWSWSQESKHSSGTQAGQGEKLIKSLYWGTHDIKYRPHRVLISVNAVYNKNRIRCIWICSKK